MRFDILIHVLQRCVYKWWYSPVLMDGLDIKYEQGLSRAFEKATWIGSQP